jgi:hypothetical protein
VCKSRCPLAHAAHSISLRIFAKKKFSRAHKAAPQNPHRAETSMECGFLARVYLLDVTSRNRAERASFGFSKAE